MLLACRCDPLHHGCESAGGQNATRGFVAATVVAVIEQVDLLLGQYTVKRVLGCVSKAQQIVGCVCGDKSGLLSVLVMIMRGGCRGLADG